MLHRPIVAAEHLDRRGRSVDGVDFKEGTQRGRAVHGIAGRRADALEQGHGVGRRQTGDRDKFRGSHGARGGLGCRLQSGERLGTANRAKRFRGNRGRGRIRAREQLGQRRDGGHAPAAGDRINQTETRAPGGFAERGHEQRVRHVGGNRLERRAREIGIAFVGQHRAERAKRGGGRLHRAERENKAEALRGGLARGEGGVFVAQHGEQARFERRELGGIGTGGLEVAVQRLESGLAAGKTEDG